MVSILAKPTHVSADMKLALHRMAFLLAIKQSYVAVQVIIAFQM